MAPTGSTGSAGPDVPEEGPPPHPLKGTASPGTTAQIVAQSNLRRDLQIAANEMASDIIVFSAHEIEMPRILHNFEALVRGAVERYRSRP